MKLLTILLLTIAVLFPNRASAATPAATGAKAPLEVVVLGSGGPRPFGRASASYIVMVDGTPRILMDAGPGAFLRIGELGLDLSSVDTILLTHLHIDHSGDLAAFFNARVLSRATAPSPTAFLAPMAAGFSPRHRASWTCS